LAELTTLLPSSIPKFSAPENTEDAPENTEDAPENTEDGLTDTRRITQAIFSGTLWHKFGNP
jgi:hypothetical protein